MKVSSAYLRSISRQRHWGICEKHLINIHPKSAKKQTVRVSQKQDANDGCNGYLIRPELKYNIECGNLEGYKSGLEYKKIDSCAKF